MTTGLVSATSLCTRTRSSEQPRSVPAWSTGDSLRAFAWFGAAVLARGPLTARIEGVFDHDQSVVSLMALDIAAGRRWPIFFDGQRYMGAIEAYVSAFFVALFGHSPAVVALSPLLFFGLFVAAQYALWRVWDDRKTANLAALIALVSAPMLTIWSVVPRGGYIELLAWGVPTLGVYRAVTRRDAPVLTRWRQVGWGFLLALGHFLNPLSLIVYVTLAVDWTLGRHGADLRRERRLDGRLLDGRFTPCLWLAIAMGLILALGVCCHVKVEASTASPFVCFFGLIPQPWGGALAVCGVVSIVGGVALWSGGAGRLLKVLASHTYVALGMVAALSPSLLFNVGRVLGWYPHTRSLPIWIRAPWDVGVNVRDGVSVLGTLLGCDPHAASELLIGQGLSEPPAGWPLTSRLLEWLAPLVCALALLLLISVAWHDRHVWKRFWSLRGEEPGTGTRLSLLGLVVASVLYLLQATSLNSSSTRYLLPMWIFLPGLLAAGVQLWPKPLARTSGLFVLGAWLLAQVNLWKDMDHPSPLRPLSEALRQHQVRGVVAEGPVALMLANLSHGEVGTLAYQSSWERLGDRYLDRFPPGQPVACVVDPTLVSYAGTRGGETAQASIANAVRELARRFPERVHLAWELDRYQVWEVGLPLSEILSAGTDTAPDKARAGTPAGAARGGR